MKNNLFFKSFDGTSLRYRIDSCQNRAPKGTFLVLHGRGESLNKYDETCDSLHKRGYDTCLFDMRGQGLSDRILINSHKHHHESFDPLMADLNAFVKGVLVRETKGPYFIIAHSMGGHVALRYLSEYETPIKAAVLCAPLVGMRFAPLPDWLGRFYIAAGNALGFGETYATPNRDWGTIEHSDKLRKLLTHDKDRFAKDVQLIKDNPALALGGVTFGWLEAAIKSCDIIQAPEYEADLQTPILIMQAGADQVVDNQSMTKLTERFEMLSLYVVEGAAHEILRETDAIQAPLWQAMDDFLIKWN